jgi:predicted enzyme related to lactoylglutathione lyase
MSDVEIRGRFLWYELMTTDLEKARGFYTAVVGWGVQKVEGSEMPYFMWSRGKEGVGGLMELPEQARKMGAPPHWLAYIGTADANKTVDQAKKLGANIVVPPTDIPKVGRFAVLSDPQGAVFAVHTPAESPGPGGPPSVGDFSWRELITLDHVGAFSFYSALFGWEKTDAMDMGPMGIYQMYGRQGHTLGGMFNKPKEMPAPPHWLLYVRVDDVNRAAEKVKKLGGKVLNGPMEVPGGDFIVQCMDPLGAVFALHQKKAETTH